MRQKKRVLLSPFGVLVAGSAGFLYLVAFLLARPVVALFAVAVTALLMGAHQEKMSPEARVTRTLPEHVRLGRRFQVVTTATSNETGILSVRSVVPEGIEQQDHKQKPGRDRASQILTVRSTTTGAIPWSTILVTSRDAWGLWEKEVALRVEENTHVAPEPEWRTLGRQQGRRNPITSLVTNRLATQSDTEVRTIREFRGGDKLRDIDWGHSTRGVGVFSRERERLTNRPLLVLLDATSTMRWLRRHAKLSTASRIALATLSAARSAGARTGLVAFTDNNEELVADAGAGQDFNEAIKQLGRLPAPQATHKAPQASADPTDPPHAPKRRPAGPHPIQRALSKIHSILGGPGLVVAILDAEAAPNRTRTILRRLQSQRHEVILVIPATGPHHYVRHEAKKSVLASLGALQRTRRSIIDHCHHHKIPVFVAYPDHEVEIVREVSRRAR